MAIERFLERASQYRHAGRLVRLMAEDLEDPMVKESVIALGEELEHQAGLWLGRANGNKMFDCPGCGRPKHAWQQFCSPLCEKAGAR